MESADIVHGACLCGQITLSVPRNALPKFAGICHCLDWKTASGSLYTVKLPTATKEIQIEGQPKIYSVLSASGNTADRYFCDECGCAIMSRVKEHPETTYVNFGPFAKSGFALPFPVLEQFWRRGESWEKPFEGVTLVD